TLVPVDDGPADATGTMTVRADNQAVGRVQVGWELDGHAEAVLDAARKSALRVVLAGGRLDQDRREFAALVDEVVGPNEALADVVRRQRDDGHVVLTVARPAERDPDLVHGLLSGDLCLAITERDTP